MPHVAAPALLQRLGVVEIVAARGARAAMASNSWRPLAERIAEPRRLRLELRQAELLPDHLGALHVLALGQRDRREVLLQRRVDQHRGVLAAVAEAARAVALVAVRQHVHVEAGIGAVRHRPQQRVGVGRVDVVVDGDDELAGGAVQHRRAIHRAPDFRGRHVALADQRDDLADVGQRLVHRHPLDALDAERVAQEVEEQRLHADQLDQARFRRRHLRDDRGQDGVLPPRDGGDVHEGVELLQIDVAVRFAERRLGLQIFGVDEALDDDLGLGRHQQIDGLGLHHVDRRADQRAGDVQLVERLRQFLHRGEGDDRRRAEHDRAGQLLEAALAQLFPVVVDARPQFQRRVHAEPPPRLHLAAVVAHVLHAGVGVLGDVLRQRGVGRDVPARRRDRQRDAVEALARLVEVLAGDDDVVARRVRDDARRQRLRRGRDPARVDLLERAADADAVDLAVGGEPADQHRDVVLAALAVGDVGEQERLAVLLLDAAAELPAHQRVHLGVFVDRAVDADELAGLLQRADVVVQVGVGGLADLARAPVLRLGLVRASMACSFQRGFGQTITSPSKRMPPSCPLRSSRKCQRMTCQKAQSRNVAVQE